MWTLGQIIDDFILGVALLVLTGYFDRPVSFRPYKRVALMSLEKKSQPPKNVLKWNAKILNHPYHNYQIPIFIHYQNVNSLNVCLRNAIACGVFFLYGIDQWFSKTGCICKDTRKTAFIRANMNNCYIWSKIVKSYILKSMS